MERARRIARKALVGIGIAVVALWLLYVVVGNVFLRTRAFRSLFDAFPKRTLDYSSAWTLWPGVIHVRDCHLRVRDYADEILLVVDDGWIQIDPFALLRKRLVVRDAEVHGVSLRFRKRLDPRLPLQKTYALPPIEGFDPIPRMNVADWEPLKDGALYELFTIDVRHVQGDVREIWIQDYHFTGEAYAHGSFYLRPGKQLEIGPAHFESARGEVRVGSDVALVGSGAIDMKMPRFDLTLWPDAEMVNAMAMVDVVFDGTIPSWSFLEHRHLGEHPPHLVGGAASVHVEAHVRAGELWTGTKVTLDVHALEVQLPSMTVKTSSRIEAEVKASNGDREATLVVAARPMEVSVTGSEHWPIRAPNVTFFARSKNLALRKPFNDVRCSIDAPDVQVTDLRIFQLFLPPHSPFRIDEGAAIGKAHVDALPASGFGEATLSLGTHTASVRANDTTIAGSVDVELKLGNLNLSTLDASAAHSTIDLRDVVYTKGKQRSAPWWGRVEFDRASLRPRSKTKKLSFTATMTMRDMRPILAMYAATEGMPGWLRNVLAMEDFHGTATARLGDGADFDLDDFRATSTDVAVGARVHAHAGKKRGALFVDWKGLEVAIEIEDSHSKPILVDAREWFEAQK